MSVSYKIKKYVNSSSSKNGYYYAKAVMLDEMDLSALADKIERNCSLKRSDVMGVLTELVEVMTDALQDSKKVRINGLGSFKMSIKSELTEALHEFSADKISGFRVLFQPEYTVDKNGNRTQKLISGAKAQAYTAYTKGVNDNAE